MRSTAELAWIALSLIDHLGLKKIQALETCCEGDLPAVLKLEAQALLRVRGIGPKLAAAIRAVNLNETAAAVAAWEAQGVQIVPFSAPGYPSSLRNLSDPPATLFALGDWQPRFEGAAIVGTRSPTRLAADAASELAFLLAQRGVTIISGLALGIDTSAHLGAIACQAGRTLAILGGGVLRVYPAANLPLSLAIRRRGALLSEVPPSTSVSSSMLVARNRLISGLAKALIVIETSVDGGAMHAARRAMEQGRRVYALDLPASGNRWLMANGALPLQRQSLAEVMLD